MMTDIPDDCPVEQHNQAEDKDRGHEPSEVQKRDPPDQTKPKSPQDGGDSSNRSESLDCNHGLPTNEKNPVPIGTTLSGCSNSQVNLEQQLIKAKRDLESMVLKYAKSERENLQNKYKADELDKKLKRAIKDNDQLANRIKLLTNDKTQLTDTLNAKVAQLTVLEQKNSYLSNVQGVKLKEYEEKIKKLEVTNEELLTLIDSYKSKEGELLDFSERLSMKHMMLQTELDEALKKVPNYKDLYEGALQEQSQLIQEKEDLMKQLKSLEDRLNADKECYERLRVQKEENELHYRRHLDQLQNEIKVNRRKHQIAAKELMKEIKQLQCRLEKFDSTTATPTTTTTNATSTLIT